MKRTSTQIIAFYLIVGITWILTSDWAFRFVGYPDSTLYQTVKGCSFIVVTAGIFLLMLRKYESRNYNYLKQLENLNEQLEKHTAELAASNSELEQFAYIASHDLQEPLRMVTGFLTQIERKYEESLDDKGKEYIHYAVDGAVRMKQIIMDLLEYSRLGKRDFKYETFEISDVIAEIISLNNPLLTESQAVINYKTLGEISGGKTLIRQVFQNLILNSVKYARPGIFPIIDIRMYETSGFWEFSVTDNGIGMRKEHLDRIFVLFQRLHPRELYSGTGIGLAICKRIVENHGGRIRAVSGEGVGSTFYFSIKK